MGNLAAFAQAIGRMPLQAADQAIALLWYYSQSQQFEERSVSELAADMHALGFPRPNVTRLRDAFARSQYVVRGRRPGTFKIALRKQHVLDTRYSPVAKLRPAPTNEGVLKLDVLPASRPYLTKLASEINGTYQAQFMNSCAVMCRRIMESLIIDLFIRNKREVEIKDPNGRFLGLDHLVGAVRNGNTFNLSRGSLDAMHEIKELGDIAAHDRTYLIQPDELDGIRLGLRKLVQELVA